MVSRCWLPWQYGNVLMVQAGQQRTGTMAAVRSLASSPGECQLIGGHVFHRRPHTPFRATFPSPLCSPTMPHADAPCARVHCCHRIFGACFSSPHLFCSRHVLYLLMLWLVLARADWKHDPGTHVVSMMWARSATTRNTGQVCPLSRLRAWRVAQLAYLTISICARASTSESCAPGRRT